MGKFNQVFAALACSCSSFVMGLLNVWPSYTLSLYTAQNNTILSIPLTEVESSLLGSLPSLGAMLGTAFSGAILDKFGRKNGGVILALPVVLSWSLIVVSTTSIPILVARFLGGMTGGSSLVYAPILISEVSEDSIRGTLASIPVTLYCLGALFSYALGWFSNYRTIIWINLAASVFTVVLCALLTESPVFLLKQNREEEARAAIAHYRGCSPASKIVLEELSRLKQQVLSPVELVSITEGESEKEKLNSQEEDVIPEEQIKGSPIKTLIQSAASRRAFLIVGFTLTMQVLMGIVPVQVYAKVLFAKAAPNVSPHLCSVLLALVLVGGCLVTGAIADKAGRRLLQLSSTLLVCISMVALGVLLQIEFEPAWMIAVMLLVYCFVFNIGAGTIPYVLLAEVFISDVQGMASIILVEWVWFLNFIIIGVFPFLTKMLGVHGTFYVFGAVSLMNCVISFFIVPETKGLSTEQIQETLVRRKK